MTLGLTDARTNERTENRIPILRHAWGRRDNKHAALWATTRRYNINANLVHVTEHLYDNAVDAVQMNGSTGKWFRTAVRIRQVYLLSSILFNIFLDRIMSDALEEHDGKVSIGGTTITSLRLAGYIDALAEEE